MRDFAKLDYPLPRSKPLIQTNPTTIRLDEAENLMHQILRGPGLSVLQSLLGSCKCPNVLMANLYAEKRKWEKVSEVGKGMRGKGVKKEVEFSWVDVANVDSLHLHGFSSGDKSHPESDTICRMAEFLGLQMSFAKQCRLKKGMWYWEFKPMSYE